MDLEAPAPPTGEPAKRTGGRAGRDLRAAVGVGAALGALVIASLFAYRPAWVGVVIVAACLGLWELRQALATTDRLLPILPMWAGSLAMLVLAFTHGAEGLVVGFLLTVATVFVWRVFDTPGRRGQGEGPGGLRLTGYLRDVSAATFALVYVPLLAGFAVLLDVPADGPRRVVTFIATVVCSDVGGYAAGVLVGRHPMAPTVSPKKSWEGFAGSTLACVIGGIAFVTLLLHGRWWHGALYGLAVVCTATLGDLGESMVKRDIGIKDMGTLLPGHGGLMDRLDSLLPTAPVAWLLLTQFVPPPH